MQQPPKLEVIQAENGYVVKVTAPNPTHAAILNRMVASTREKMEETKLPCDSPDYLRMQWSMELLEAARSCSDPLLVATPREAEEYIAVLESRSREDEARLRDFKRAVEAALGALAEQPRMI